MSLSRWPIRTLLFAACALFALAQPASADGAPPAAAVVKALLANAHACSQLIGQSVVDCEDATLRAAQQLFDDHYAPPAAKPGASGTDLDFDAFIGNMIYRETPHPIVLDQTSRSFRGVLESAAQDGPVFDGRFAVAVWGCGTSCEAGMLLDLATGKALMCPGGAPVDYHIDSSLIGCRAGGDVSNIIVTTYYSFDGAFHPLRMVSYDADIREPDEVDPKP